MPTPTIEGSATEFLGLSGTSYVLNKPSVGVTLANDDHLVAVLRAQNTNFPTDFVAPDGTWTRYGPAFIANDTNVRVTTVYVKKITNAAGEPSSYTFTGPTSASRKACKLFVVRGAVGVAAANTSFGTVVGSTGMTSAAYTPATGNGEPGLSLFIGASEFSVGNNHVPTATPSGYTLAFTTSAPDANTANARTYSWIGSKAHTAGAAVPAATISWTVAAGAATVGLTFQGAPAADPSGPGFPLYNGLGATVKVYYTTADGPRTPADVRLMAPGYGTIDTMLAGEFYWAHRGGSASFPEHSLHAYTQSIARGYNALEISLNRSSDGMWFGLHDMNLDRTSVTTTGIPDASTMTWAEIQAYQITLGPGGAQPYLPWDELIYYYGETHVLICDPKYRHSSHRTEFLDKCANDIGTDRCIVKFFYDTPSLATAAASRGLKTWGYIYAANIDSDSTWATKAASWDILGMEYTAAQSYWNAVLALGKPVVGFICPNEAAVTTSRSKGAQGYQCSGTAVIRPAGVHPPWIDPPARLAQGTGSVWLGV